jgi:hypothetical protein
VRRAIFKLAICIRDRKHAARGQREAFTLLLFQLQNVTWHTDGGFILESKELKWGFFVGYKGSRKFAVRNDKAQQPSANSQSTTAVSKQPKHKVLKVLSILYISVLITAAECPVCCLEGRAGGLDLQATSLALACARLRLTFLIYSLAEPLEII